MESKSEELLGKQIKLLNERHLHYKVIDCIRNNFAELVVVPGLGEMQTTAGLRIDAKKKGYTAGQPDIPILNQTSQYSGFAIELKTPKGDGEVSARQKDYLERLRDLNYKTLISNDYDVVAIELSKFYMDVRFPCRCCSVGFKFKQMLNGHLNTWRAKEI